MVIDRDRDKDLRDTRHRQGDNSVYNIEMDRDAYTHIYNLGAWIHMGLTGK